MEFGKIPLKKLAKVIEVMAEALKDDYITAVERNDILKEFTDIILSARRFLGREDASSK